MTSAYCLSQLAQGREPIRNALRRSPNPQMKGKFHVGRCSKPQFAPTLWPRIVGLTSAFERKLCSFGHTCDLQLPDAMIFQNLSPDS